LAKGTLRNVSFSLKHLAKFADLNEPESVKKFIADKPCANSYKTNLAKSYNYYAKVNEIAWKKPHFRYENKLPRIPTTQQINKLIDSASRKYATIFRILAETGVMPCELSRVRRSDLDLQKRTMHVQGAKGHTSRVFKLKKATAAMLKTYMVQHKGTRLFPASEYMSRCYRDHRNRIAEKLSDPSLLSIRLYDFRHYFASMLYWRTKDILLVKQKLGHKRLETTLIHTQLVNFEENEFTVRAADNVKDATTLLESGFQYVATTPQDVMMFRKPK
jgi:integrase